MHSGWYFPIKQISSSLISELKMLDRRFPSIKQFSIFSYQGVFLLQLQVKQSNQGFFYLTKDLRAETQDCQDNSQSEGQWLQPKIKRPHGELMDESLVLIGGETGSGSAWCRHRKKVAAWLDCGGHVRTSAIVFPRGKKKKHPSSSA